jgi:serine protease AprX
MRPRSLLRASAALFVVTATLSAAPAAHALAVRASNDGGSVAVIVEGADASAARAAVVAAGGTVKLDLSLIGAVSAVVDPEALVTLESDASVHVIPDATIHPTSNSFGGDPTDTPDLDPQLDAMGTAGEWSPTAGQGVAVALVDTGVADTPDLHGSRLVRGPDFSGEGEGIDHYGHGTFMAGLIAGDGTASASSTVHHYGIAPGSTLVSVKVAGRDGSTTVSRVIAGIGWVVTHVNQYHIGVLNLSFGVDPPMPYVDNPLSAAAEAAWATGITVVASAGNEGTKVTSPGTDPYVLTVGAVNTMHTETTADDFVPVWSGRQSFGTYAKPNLMAPGVSVVSLRAPGSTVDKTHPEGRVGTTYFRGSGTSMSTALVAGAAAVLLSHHPLATPDDIKGAFVDTTVKITGGREINLAAADQAQARPGWWQHFPVAFNGLGRGLHKGMKWTGSRWTASRWTTTRWTTARWDASRWTASRWTASRWTAQQWASSRWTGSRWTGSRWTGSRWTGSRWTGSRWTGSRWTGSRWTAEAWLSQGWG